MIQYVSIKESEKIVNQSARVLRKTWRICFDEKQYHEGFIGWTASTNTQFQIHLNFPSLEEALRFAQKKRYHVTHIEYAAPLKKIRKSYADNFSYARF